MWVAFAPGIACAGDAPKYLGATTCGESTCHAAARPWLNSSVAQDEYLVWSKQDPHSLAYTKLRSPRGRKIASHLGISDPTQATTCLQCHANKVPPERRGTNFDITEGITCEVCHGGAEPWLGAHSSHRALPGAGLSEGMYPTADPRARAALCTSCHGAAQGLITHRLLAAGHPRTPFELDTYTVAQPGHYVIDEDYRSRKPTPGTTQTWAIGQIVSAGQLLDRLIAISGSPRAVFHEYSVLDCQGCHRAAQTSASARAAYRPALPSLDVAPLLMATTIAKRLDAELHSQLRKKTSRLRNAMGGNWSSLRAAALELREPMDQLAALIEQQELTLADAVWLTNEFLHAIASGRFSDYLDAEQTLLSVATLLDAQRQAGQLTPVQSEAVETQLKLSYQATRDPARFSLSQLRSAFRAIRAALNKEG